MNNNIINYSLKNDLLIDKYMFAKKINFHYFFKRFSWTLYRLSHKYFKKLFNE